MTEIFKSRDTAESVKTKTDDNLEQELWTSLENQTPKASENGTFWSWEAASNFYHEIQTIKETEQPISLSGLLQSLSDDTNVGRANAYVSGLRNQNPMITDEEILQHLWVPAEKMHTTTPDQLILLIKRDRITSHLQHSAKANEQTPTYQLLQQQLADKNLTEYQKSLYFKADVVAAFDAFMHTPYFQKDFATFAETLNTSQSPTQLMVEFLTSEMYEDTLIHMLNKQQDDPNRIDVNYIKENMFYRAQVWKRLKQIDYEAQKGNLTPEAQEEDKRNVMYAISFLRAKTDIINKAQGKTNEEITQEVKELLKEPLPDQPELTYIHILAKPEIIKFIEGTVISAIRTEEKADGTIVFNEKTKVDTITDLQFYRYLSTSYGEGKEQTLQLNLQMSPEDQEIIDALQALGIGKQAIKEKENPNSKAQQALKASQKKLQEAEILRKKHQYERARQYRESKVRSLGSSTQQGKSVEMQSMQTSTGKEIMSSNPYVTAFITQSQQGESIPVGKVEKRTKDIEGKLFHRYIESPEVELHYEEIQPYLEDWQIKDRMGLEQFLREQQQLSPERIQTLLDKIQRFNPDRYDHIIKKYLEHKKTIFMKQNRELKLASFGRIFDYIKEALNTTTTDTQQNFAQDFKFNTVNDLEIQNGQLIIKGDMKGTPISFYYDLTKGDISTNSIIGKDNNAFYLHNTTIKSHLTNIGPFNGILEKGKQALWDNKDQFQKVKEVEGEKKAVVGERIAQDILERNNQVNTSSILQMNMERLIEKNQTMQSVIETFQLTLDNHTIGENEQPELYRLFFLLDNSITTRDNAVQLRECCRMLAELTHIHRKIQHTWDHQHTPAELTSTAKSDWHDWPQDPFLEDIFSEGNTKDPFSRGKALNTYLSAYSEGVGKEEKINIEKLHADLLHIKNQESYEKTPWLLVLEEKKEDPHPWTPERDEEFLKEEVLKNPARGPDKSSTKAPDIDPRFDGPPILSA